MNDPLEMLKMIKNPEQYVRNYIKNTNNPILSNLIEMAQKNDTKSLEQFARNMLKEQGKDYDEIASLFK